MRRPISVHWLLILTQLCFGILSVVGKMTTPHVPAMAIVLVRVLGGTILFSLAARRRGTLRLDRKDLPMLIACSLLGVVINQECFIGGVALSTATNATVLGATIPVFTAVFALLLGKEPARWRRLLGIAVAFCGVAILVGADKLSMSSDHLLGSGLVLINAASYGLYLVVVGKLAHRYDPMALIAILFAIAIPFVAPLGIWQWSHYAAPTTVDLEHLLFIIIVPTFGAYAFVQMALARAEASLVASYIYLQPVVAAVFAVLLLGEAVPGLRSLLGAGIIFAGIALSIRAQRN